MYRGACLFQTKYENCKAAGAVGAAVINAENTFTIMPVVDIEDNYPFVFMTSDDGAALVNLTTTMDNITVSVGSGVASSFPVPGFTDPPAFSAFDLTTAMTIVVEPPPFEYVTWASFDSMRELIYVHDTNSTYWVLNVTDIVRGESASYDIVGSFPSDGFVGPFGDFYISQQGDTPVMGVQEASGTTYSLYDLSDTLNPGTDALCVCLSLSFSFASLRVHLSSNTTVNECTESHSDLTLAFVHSFPPMSTTSRTYDHTHSLAVND